jgi:hypothetical protein
MSTILSRILLNRRVESRTVVVGKNEKSMKFPSFLPSYK